MSTLKSTYESAYLHDQWEAIYRDTPGEHALNDAIMDKVVERLAIKPGDVVLDAGCGVGDHSIRFARRGFRCVGVDISETILARARQRAQRLEIADKLEFRCAALEQLDIPGDGFDAVHCRGVLMHIPDWKSALTNLVRVLKPGGRIVVMECNQSSLYYAVATLAKQRAGGTVRKSEEGTEFWGVADGHPFVARKMNIGFLRKTMRSAGVEPIAAFATSVLEIGRANPGLLRNAMVATNRAWFSLGLPWWPSAGVAVIGEKRRSAIAG